MELSSQINDSFHSFVATTYDVFHHENSADELAFYTALLDERPGRILEPGCGTGRFLLPIARTGRQITGIDISTDMLAVCESKLRAEGLEMPLHLAKFEEYCSDTAYANVVIPYSTVRMIVNHNELRAAFRSFYSLLQADGRLIFEVSNVDLAALVKQATVTLSFGLKNFGAAGNYEVRSRSTLSQVDMIERREIQFLPEDSLVQEAHRQTVAYRWYTRLEFAQMLELSGFQLECVLGDFSREAATEKHRTHIYVARKANHAH